MVISSGGQTPTMMLAYGPCASEEQVSQKVTPAETSATRAEGAEQSGTELS